MIATNVKEGILSTIGETPLVKLKNVFAEYPFHFYAKMEMFNPGGSIKDRTSYHMLSEAFKQGKIAANSTIIESTSGNMGIGLAQLCLYYGLRLILVVDPHINKESAQLLRIYKAELVFVDELDDNGGYLKTRLATVQKLLKTIPNSYNPDQYHNKNNPLAHRQTFTEIIQQLGAAPDYIIIPTSTCGTIMGFINEIDKQGYATKVIAVDAQGSVLFNQKPRERLIPGMGASQKSHFLDAAKLHAVQHISDSDAVVGCHKLLKLESMLAGGSSGAVITAIEKIAYRFKEDNTVIAIFPDRGERYLNTIYNTEWIATKFPELLNNEKI